MIGLLIAWFFVGILLVSLSGVLYYYDAFGFLGFSLILLQGIVVLLVSAYHILSWQAKWKEPGKASNKGLKRAFMVLAVLSMIIVVIGVLGYLLSEFGVLVLDLHLTNTFLAFLTFGLFGTVCGIFSMIYVDRNRPNALLSAIIEQQNLLNKMKSESENIGSEIRSIGEYLKKSHESAMEIEARNKQELEGR
ncbi:MAG: hypothetical protein M8353_00875 [ANME-2 cluster archaeon]|nr:hypothetical protein [ANME-2 cluster archaeon]